MNNKNLYNTIELGKLFNYDFNKIGFRVNSDIQREIGKGILIDYKIGAHSLIDREYQLVKFQNNDYASKFFIGKKVY